MTRGMLNLWGGMLPTRIPRILGLALAASVLAGCAVERGLVSLVEPEGVARYYTRTDVVLRSGQEDESSEVALLPKGTEVVPAFQTGSHCSACLKVTTPEGTGWVYTRYLEMRLPDDS